MNDTAKRENKTKTKSPSPVTTSTNSRSLWSKTAVADEPAMGFLNNNSGNWLFEAVVIFILTALVYLIVRIYKGRRYFQERNIPCIESVFIFGSYPGTGLHRHVALAWTEIYQQLAPHKIGGFYEMFLQRFYMVRDPEYAQLIFMKHFTHFTDRGFGVDVKTNPLDDHLFFHTGAKWRYLRSKLAPVFTTGRLKWMSEHMENCANSFLDHLEKHVPQNKDTDLHEMIATFSLELIASTVFGIESNIVGSKNNKFREHSIKFFEPSIRTSISQYFRLAHPKLLKFFKIKTVDPESTDFFVDLIRSSFKVRTSTDYARKDIIQLLLELYQKGSIQSVEEGDDSEAQDSSAVKIEMTEELMAAQAFLFLMAGFETTSSTIYNLTYFLSVNPSVQEKARKEAQNVKQKYGGFSFESLKEMKYLDLCIMETLRIMPPVPIGFRQCTKDFTFPNGIEVQKGDLIAVPVYALQNNPEYYPEPNKFIPERFETPPPKGTYFPFGEGPRICIGKRFAEVEIKMVVAKMLDKFSFHPSDRDSTTDVLRVRGIKKNTILLYPRDGFLVKVKKL